jgi:hypothetical protein
VTQFETLATKLGGLVAERNKSYGNSFAKTGEFLRILYPDGISPEQMVDALLMARIFDKQMRIAQGHKTDSYEDIAGYGILGAVNAAKVSATGIEVQPNSGVQRIDWSNVSGY